MPLPRNKDDGSSGAPILNILRAHVKLTDVDEHIEPYTIIRKSDGRTFTLDPAFDCAVEILADGQNGTDNGARFFETFKYKNTEKEMTGEWINQENPQAERSPRKGEAWIFVGRFHPRARREPRGFIDQDTARSNGFPNQRAFPNYGLSPFRTLTLDLAARDVSFKAKGLPSNGANDIDDPSDATTTEDAGSRTVPGRVRGRGEGEG